MKLTDKQKQARREKYHADPQKFRDAQNLRNQDPEQKSKNKQRAKDYRQQLKQSEDTDS